MELGLQKIAAMLNDNTLVFSYHPKFGANGALPAGARGFIYPAERMQVIYIKNDFQARDGKSAQWHCAKTIIHEVSHRALGTKDHSYGWQGIQPSNRNFRAKHAIENADSWAYFVAAMSYNLTPTQRDEFLKPKHRY